MSFTNTIMILGVQGQGKTTLMTKFAYEEAVQFNRRILTNYKIKGVKMLQISFGEIVKMLATQEVPQTIIGVDGKPRNFKRAYARAFGKINKELTVDDVVKDTVMCFDEIHVGAHAYDFLSKGSRTLAEFSSQIRKRGILLLGSAQFFSQVAKQVRIQMNTIINVTKVDKSTKGPSFSQVVPM